MCIDDRQPMLQVRKANLEPLGYSVITATSAATAITMLEQTPIVAVFVEYKSEGMDAEAVAFQIKQRFPNQPIILLSAYSDMPERVLWLVDDYVMRSEPLERLAEVVERLTHPIPKVAPRFERLQRWREAVA
jgi:CheY-like chemotaxis protein